MAGLKKYIPDGRNIFRGNEPQIKLSIAGEWYLKF